MFIISLISIVILLAKEGCGQRRLHVSLSKCSVDWRNDTKGDICSTWTIDEAEPPESSDIAFCGNTHNATGTLCFLIGNSTTGVGDGTTGKFIHPTDIPGISSPEKPFCMWGKLGATVNLDNVEISTANITMIFDGYCDSQNPSRIGKTIAPGGIGDNSSVVIKLPTMVSSGPSVRLLANGSSPPTGGSSVNNPSTPDTPTNGTRNSSDSSLTSTNGVSPRTPLDKIPSSSPTSKALPNNTTSGGPPSSSLVGRTSSASSSKASPNTSLASPSNASPSISSNGMGNTSSVNSLLTTGSASFGNHSYLNKIGLKGPPSIPSTSLGKAPPSTSPISSSKAPPSTSSTSSSKAPPSTSSTSSSKAPLSTPSTRLSKAPPDTSSTSSSASPSISSNGMGNTSSVNSLLTTGSASFGNHSYKTGLKGSQSENSSFLAGIIIAAVGVIVIAIIVILCVAYKIRISGRTGKGTKSGYIMMPMTDVDCE